MINEKVRVAVRATKGSFGVFEDLEASATPRRTLGESADELLKDVPREVIEQLPVDGAENQDHYLYSARKK